MNNIQSMNFEELLQCPVCFELPNGAIQQCEQGHAICQSCQRKLNNCPVCRGLFYGTRNYIMEELIEKMKRANLKGGKPNKKPDNSAVKKIRRRTPPLASAGFYACKFPDCQKTYPVCRMLTHIRQQHKEYLCETQTQDGVAYTRVIDIMWIPGLTQVFAMQISDMGLFYLIIHSNEDGTLIAWLQMAALHKVAQKFLYELNFHSENSAIKTVFIDKVQSLKQPDARFLSQIATPMATIIKRNNKIFNMRKECPCSRLHLAITFADNFGTTITPTKGTKIYKNCWQTPYAELNRNWKFDLQSKDNILQTTSTPNNHNATRNNSSNYNNRNS